jgi:hypothetical protein
VGTATSAIHASAFFITQTPDLVTPKLPALLKVPTVSTNAPGSGGQL